MTEFNRNIVVSKTSVGYPKIALEEAHHAGSTEFFAKPERTPRVMKLPNV
jgi:hypothetical protein